MSDSVIIRKESITCPYDSNAIHDWDGGICYDITLLSFWKPHCKIVLQQGLDGVGSLWENWKNAKVLQFSAQKFGFLEQYLSLWFTNVYAKTIIFINNQYFMKKLIIISIAFFLSLPIAAQRTVKASSPLELLHKIDRKAYTRGYYKGLPKVLQKVRMQMTSEINEVFLADTIFVISHRLVLYLYRNTNG